MFYKFEPEGILCKKNNRIPIKQANSSNQFYFFKVKKIKT